MSHILSHKFNILHHVYHILFHNVLHIYEAVFQSSIVCALPIILVKPEIDFYTAMCHGYVRVSP